MDKQGINEDWPDWAQVAKNSGLPVEEAKARVSKILNKPSSQPEVSEIPEGKGFRDIGDYIPPKALEEYRKTSRDAAIAATNGEEPTTTTTGVQIDYYRSDRKISCQRGFKCGRRLGVKSPNRLIAAIMGIMVIGLGAYVSSAKEPQDHFLKLVSDPTNLLTTQGGKEFIDPSLNYSDEEIEELKRQGYIPDRGFVESVINTVNEATPSPEQESDTLFWDMDDFMKEVKEEPKTPGRGR